MNGIRFTPALDDLIAAQQLHQLAVLPRFAAWVGVIGLIAGAGMFALTEGAWMAVAIFLFVLLTATGLAILVARFWTIPRLARKAMTHDKSLSADYVFNWDTNIAKASSDSGSWEQALADFPCWKANRDTILLYRQTQLFHFFPTRAFPDGALRDDLIAAVKASGVSSSWPPR